MRPCVIHRNIKDPDITHVLYLSIDKEYFTAQLTAKELRVFVIYSG